MSQFIEMFGNPVTNTKGWKTAKIKDVAPEMPSKEQLSGKIWLLNLDMIESNTGRIIEKVYEDVENALSVQSFDEGNVLFSKYVKPFFTFPYSSSVISTKYPSSLTAGIGIKETLSVSQRAMLGRLGFRIQHSPNLFNSFF